MRTRLPTNGNVAITPLLDNGVRGVFRVNSSADISTVVDSTEDFRGFFEVAMNNVGGVAFAALSMLAMEPASIADRIPSYTK